MAEKQKDNTMNIYQRLHQVMKAVSYVQKEEKKVNNQYRFVSHDGVTSAVRPALIQNGVVAIPQNLKTQQNGNRTEVFFDMRFVNIDSPDDYIDVPTFGYGIDQQDKGVGKALSYGVKYALLKALSLETGDDPERDNVDYVPPIHMEMGADDVPPEVWLNSTIDGMYAYVEKPRSTMDKFVVTCGDKRKDPIFSKLTEEQRDTFEIAAQDAGKKLEAKLKERLNNE